MTQLDLIPVSLDQMPPKQDASADVPVVEETTTTRVSSVQKEKSLRSRKKSVKTVRSTKLNKRAFVERLLKDGITPIWPREMKTVNRLLEIVPDPIFWNSIELGFKLNSICWLLSDKGREILNQEYKKYKFVPQEEKPVILDNVNNNVDFEIKIESNVAKPISVKDFLNLWQKKN